MSRASLFRIVREAYAGGEYAHLRTRNEAEDVGDTLFTFAVREFCEDGITRDDAVSRCETAIHELEAVRDALRGDA
jgi:hypothetical protein